MAANSKHVAPRLRHLLAGGCFLWALAAVTPAFAFDYGLGGYGSGAYNVGQLDPTTTVLASSANPSTAGDSITLTATVTPSTATGTITFKNGAATLGTATLGHASGSLTTAALSAGSHSLTAVYGGNVTHSGSTSNTVTQVVNAAADGESSSGESTDGGGGGHRGSVADMAKRIAEAKAFIFARFEGSLHRTVAKGGQASSASSVRHIATPFPTIGRSSSSRALVQKPATHGIALSEKRGRLVALIGTEEILFRDVPVTEWYAPYVAALVEQQIASGYADATGKPTGEFGVSNPVTNAEVLKMALEAANVTITGGSPRNDTAKGTWASAYVKTAEDKHFSVFSPSLDVNGPATRGEVVQTLMEVLGFPLGKTPSTFADVPADDRHSVAIALAAFYGFIQGYTDADGHALNTFRPNDPINRAEVAKIIALAREVLR
jgi:hypothetical protein